MKKIAVSIADLKKKKQTTKNLTPKAKHILVLVMFILLCLFSGGVQARGEIPDNIIQEKENSINEIMLGASEELTLTRKYEDGTEAIQLTWNKIEGVAKYKIHQSTEGESEKVIATMSGTSVTLNNNNAGIKDEEAPTMPQVTATQTEDGLGNNIAITASTDKGTTYRHTVEVAELEKENILDVIFVIDHTKSMKKHMTSVKSAMKTIGEKFIDQGARVAIVEFGGATWGFTANKTTFSNNISKMYQITHKVLNDGVKPARELFKSSSTAKNKVMVIFSDMPKSVSKIDDALKPAYEEGIKCYSIGINVEENKLNALKKYGSGISSDGNAENLKSAFEKMYDDAIEDIKLKSNTVSTTVTSGLKGYQYAVTTSSTHTFTNEEIVGIEEIPSYISGEEQMVQYLHIRAVDNSGNASETRSILLQVPAKITLKSEYTYGENEVPLSWTINDSREGYKYRVYQKEENQKKFTLIATNNSVETITKNETKQDRYTTPGTYTWTVPQGVTEIKVIVVSAGEMGEESLFGEYSSKENEETNGEENEETNEETNGEEKGETNEETNGEENGEANEETNGEENEEIKEEIKEYTLQVNENEEYQVKIGKRRK